MNVIVEFLLLLVFLKILQLGELWGLVAIVGYLIVKPVAWVFYVMLEDSIKQSVREIQKAAKKK